MRTRKYNDQFRRNKYCPNCLKTQRTLDIGSHIVCEVCSKRWERVVPIVTQRVDIFALRTQRQHEAAADQRREAM